MKHELFRVRHEPRRRSVVVQATEWVTPRMRRLRLGGSELTGFISQSPDDHLKVIVAANGEDPIRRDYTPRRFDAERQELEIDFAIHDGGPVTAWAESARVGDTVGIGGPRGSLVLPYDYDWWLLIGDETALPAIGRRLEEMPPDLPVTTIVAVVDEGEHQTFATKAKHTAIWTHRPLEKAAEPAALLDALRGFKLPAGEGFVWIAAEAGVARSLKRHLIDERQHPAQWLRASGYWVKGEADASHKSID